jgi:signal transduction histidine kinase
MLAGGIILVALLLDLLLLYLGDSTDSSRDNYQSEFALIESLMLGEEDVPAAFAVSQADIAAALDVPVNLYNRNEFAGLEAENAALAAGAIITLYDDNDQAIHYKLLAETDRLLAIGPVPEPESTRPSPRLVSWSYYLLVGLLILLWIRPFYRDLDRLRSAALQFGDNDFSARVDVAPDSRILPVARSFNAMAERIEYLVSSHRDLTNAVSHELRTPLARFKFSMEILARTQDAAKKEEYLRNMKQDVEELERLIDEMLSYAKLNEQNLLMELVEMDIRPWLQELVAAYDGEPVRVSLAFQPETPNTITATLNPALMARAINNILRNCLRYADALITVNVSQQDGITEITIQDDGKGIAADKLAAIFEPFTRGDTSRDRQSGGYGLGLAIAARIVQRHHGSIEAGNTSPHGAKFVLKWNA